MSYMLEELYGIPLCRKRTWLIYGFHVALVPGLAPLLTMVIRDDTKKKLEDLEYLEDEGIFCMKEE